MPISSLKRLTAIRPPGDAAREKDAETRAAREACREFESIFVRELLKVMRSTVPDEKSRQNQMYIGLFDEQISRLLAERGMGLGDLMAESLSGPDFSVKNSD